MATHPHKPKDPKRPTRNRHTVAAAARPEKHDARGEVVLVERDVQRVLAWLNAEPLRTITSEGMRTWVAKQDPAWTPGYWSTIRARATEALTEATAATANQTRARLLHLIDGLIPQCRHLKTGTGQGVGAGTVVLRDPSTPEFAEFERLRDKLWQWKGFTSEAKIAREAGKPAPSPAPPEFTAADARRYTELEHSRPFLTEIDHAAVQGYLKLVAQMTGLVTDKHQHLHVHSTLANPESDLSELPTAELIAVLNGPDNRPPAG
jgi:hypothetical protein